MAFEHYILAGGKKLRCGFTTGTCAALAAAAAARRLLTGVWPEEISLLTPKGLRVSVVPEACTFHETAASCAVRKDGGDDVDCTAGLLIFARVERTGGTEITVDGGEGVGRVTKPGLDQPVGAAAINSVPREMILKAVSEVCDATDYSGGLAVTIYVPDGAAVAEKTFNPRLGIEGGISILGTSGIVEPMSQQALVDTIVLELKQHAAAGAKRLILTPGNYGLDYLRTSGLGANAAPVVRCSNFIGETLDAACALGFQEILLVGHVGKLVKLAGGIMNTHSSIADCRTELFCAHAACCGASPALCRRIMDGATTDACIEILKEAGLQDGVMASILSAVHRHLDRRVGSEVTVGAVLFSNVYGELGKTPGAQTILDLWN